MAESFPELGDYAQDGSWRPRRIPLVSSRRASLRQVHEFMAMVDAELRERGMGGLAVVEVNGVRCAVGEASGWLLETTHRPVQVRFMPRSGV